MGLSLFAVLWWAALAFYVRSNSTLLLLGKIGFGISGFLLLYSILYAIGLRQPMLRLTPKTLVYRKVGIPWNSISDVVDLTAREGSCVGIVLKEGKIRVTPSQRGAIGPTVVPFLLKDLKRYGAIAVPQARGITAAELREAILDYKAKAVAAL